MVLSGKGEAFVPLVTPYRRSLLSLAFRQTGNWEDAAEVTQETLLRAFKYLRKFNTAGSFKNWIFQILINESRNFQRRRAKVRRILDMARAAVPDRSTGEASRPRDGESGSPLPSAAADPERETLRRELRTRFLECLDGLGRREKEVFLLRDIEGLTSRKPPSPEMLVRSVRGKLSSRGENPRDLDRNSGDAKEIHELPEARNPPLLRKRPPREKA